MKLKTLSLALGVSIASLTSVFSFADRLYVGANYNHHSYDEGAYDADLNSVSLKLGYYFNRHFSGELRAGKGFGDDTENAYGYDVDLELDNFYGAYLRAGYPMSKTIYPYAVVGMTRASFDAHLSNYPSLGVEESVTDASFGLGADFRLSNTLSLNLEYMDYISDDNIDLDGLSIGINKHF